MKEVVVKGKLQRCEERSTGNKEVERIKEEEEAEGNEVVACPAE